jgi:hypothetical protein
MCDCILSREQKGEGIESRGILESSITPSLYLGSNLNMRTNGFIVLYPVSQKNFKTVVKQSHYRLLVQERLRLHGDIVLYS